AREHRLQHAVGVRARRLVGARPVEAPDGQVLVVLEDLRLRAEACGRLRAVDPDVLGLDHFFCSSQGATRPSRPQQSGRRQLPARCPSVNALLLQPPLVRTPGPGPYAGGMERQNEYVLRTVEERGVRFVRLWFTDVLGFLKSVEITPAELEMALEEGMTFDGSTIEGYSRIQESDMLAKPDPNTFELLPGSDGDAAVARMFCDIQLFSGEPFDGDPRYVMKRNLERAREKGFTFFVGPEMEFFYFKTGKKIEPLDTA